MARSQFVDAIKTNTTAVTAAMSFFAAVMAFAADFGGGVLIALLLIATLLLVSYNSGSGAIGGFSALGLRSRLKRRLTPGVAA
jgi:hypothetical protein